MLPVTALATAQYPERLVLEGNAEIMMATPLEDLFSATHPKPKALSPFSSACWRGYIGQWEIRDGKLFLVHLERKRLIQKGGEDGPFVDTVEDIPLSLIFPRAAGPVLADWYSGVIRLVRGEQLQYVHMGFASVYEQDIYLTVVKGRIVDRKTIDNRGKEQRSDVDLAWRELGRMTDTGGVGTRTPEAAAAEEAGHWMDARALWPRMQTLIKSKETVVVRAIYFTKRLWFDGALEMPIDCSGVSDLPREGTAAEVTGMLLEDDRQGIVLRVKAARELPPGSAIERSAPDAKER